MAKPSKAQQRRFDSNAGEHQQEILRRLRRVAQARGLNRVWEDWTEMGAIALARLDRAQFDAREKRYLEIIRGYSKDELEDLVQAFAHLVMGMEMRMQAGEFGDMLGSTYMMLGMGNEEAGQFFTPYEVSLLMAKMLMGDELASSAARRGFVQLAEPASGAGGMVIAAAHVLHDQGLNFQQQLHVTSIDVDRRCTHMCFIQLALLHVPAVVVHGNALSNDQWAHWFTPAHIMGNWSRRLRQREACEQIQQDAGALAPSSAPAPADVGGGDAVVVPMTSQAARVLHAAALAGQLQLF